MKIDPKLDGVEHLNVYSRGKTSLGRFLSNFALSPVETVDGHFYSIEAYWYWLRSDHPDKNNLRYTHGSEAKKMGRQLRGKDWIETDEFKEKIKAAITIKIKNDKEKYNELVQNKLPLKHYYVMSGKVIEPSSGKWILDHLNDLARPVQTLF